MQGELSGSRRPQLAGAHAAAAARAFPALCGRGVRLGGACRGDDSFPYARNLAAAPLLAQLSQRGQRVLALPSNMRIAPT